MQKTKLGISIGLFGAGLYFMGIISIIPLVLIAGYVLLFEENEWLKKSAVKSVVIVVVFSILFALSGLLTSSSTFLTTLVHLFGGELSMLWLTRIVTLINTVLSVAQTLILLLLGFKALKQKDHSIGSVDKTINKHI